MNHQTNPICDNCGERVERFKFLKVLKDKEGKKTYLCKDCYKNRRLNFRSNTIKETGIAEDLNDYKKLERREYNKEYQLKKKEVKLEKDNNWIQKRYRKQSDNNSVQESNSPIKIKGSQISKDKSKSFSYLTMQEQQDMLRDFMSRGNTFEQAKEKIKEIKNQLKKTRELQKDISEEDFKVSKNKLLEGLR